ncbi:MAG: TIGR03663 family protein [Dehalococcoidia bacterium]|nr:TIGR03663 family protein [Dehalococcoidia bacterium]
MSDQASSSPALALSASPFERLASLRLRLSWELAIYILFIGVGAGLRFWDLGARAYHHDESLHAQYAFYLFRDGTYHHDPMMHGPFQFFGIAFTFVLFGVSNYTARILPALVGTALIGAPFFLRRQLGRSGALAAAGLIAFSPTLLYFSRFARGDIHIALWTLGLAICLWRYIEEGRHRYLYIAAGLLALSFATKEVTFLNAAIFIAFLDLWIAQTLAAQIRERHQLEPAVAPFLFLALVPFAWAIVALWPFLSAETRHRLGLGERPRAADFLLILGTLSLPQFAAAIQIPLESLGLVGENDWSNHLFTLNLGLLGGSENVTIEVFTGYITVTALIAATAVVGLRWNWRSWLIMGAIFYIVFGLLYSTFLTNPHGFGSGIWNSLDYWLAQQGEQRGNQPFYYYLVLLPAYEFLPLLFAFATAGVALAKAAFGPNTDEGNWARIIFTIAGSLAILALAAGAGGMPKPGMVLGVSALVLLVFSLRVDPFLRFLTFWMIMALFAYSVAGEKMPWLNVHLTLPVVILAAYILGQLWELVRAAEWRFRIPAYTCPLLAAVLGAGAVAFATFGPSDSMVAPILVGLAAVLAIAALTITLRGRAMAVVPLAALVGILLLFSVRAAWMASFQEGDGADAREMLVYTQSSPAIPRIMHQIEQVAEETGLGKDLPIRVDDGGIAFSWPWVWYLRDYHDVQYPNMAGGYDLPANAIALVTVDNDAAMQSHLQGYGPGQRYPHRWWFPETYRSLEELGNGKHKNIMTTFADFVATLGDGDTWHTWWRYFRDHEPPEPKGSADAVAYFPKEFTPEEIARREEPLEAPKADSEGRFTLGEHGSGPGRFGKPAGLAVDGDGNLYVADSGNDRVQKFDAEGNFIAEVGSPGDGEGEFNEPWGVAVDSQGNLYVADTWNNRIQKFDRDLNFVTQWGKPASDLTNPKAYDFWGPRDVAVDSEGNVWVADTGTNRILKFAGDGTFLASLGKPGSEPGELREPVGVEFAANGDIIVADAWNSRIQRFDKQFNPVAQFPMPGWIPDDPSTKPYLVLAPDGSIIASETARHRVLRIGADGSILSTLEGTGEKALINPTGLALDNRGFLYISNSGANQIRRVPLTDMPVP